MPDLERAHAGLLGVARLQARDHPARFVAQAPRLVERGLIACAHEAAVALERRKLLGKRARKLRGQRRIGRSQRNLHLGNRLGGRLGIDPR